MSEMLNCVEVAKMARVCKQTIDRLALKGQIPSAVRVGYQWRFHAPAIEAWLYPASKPEAEAVPAFVHRQTPSGSHEFVPVAQ